MAETPIHGDNLINTVQRLQYYYRDQANVYVGGNMLFFYEEGNRHRHVAPDAFVVFGLSKAERKYYQLWEERKAPDVIFEFTSKSTRREDLGKKRKLYRDLFKTEEYFLFDPTEEYLKPSMQGFRLVDGDYVPIPLVESRLVSERLNMWLERDGRELRLRDRKTNELLLTPSERAERAEQHADRAQQQAKQAQQRAEQAQQRAEQAQQQAVQAQQQTDALAAENERLRRLLENRPGE